MSTTAQPMSTPKRLESSPEKNVQTPFKERALHEKRLRDELLLLSTPGWRQEENFESGGTREDLLSSNPQVLNSCLKELSSLLFRKHSEKSSDLCQSKTSSANFATGKVEISSNVVSPDKLSNNERFILENPLLHVKHSSREANSGTKRSLSQEIFSSHESNLRRKSRRLEDELDVVIMDAQNVPKGTELPTHFIEQTDETNSEKLSRDGPAESELPVNFMISEDENPTEYARMSSSIINLEKGAALSEDDISMDSFSSGDELLKNPRKADELAEEISQESHENDQVQVIAHSIPIRELRSIVKANPNVINFQIPHKSYLTMNRISMDFIKQIAHEFKVLSSLSSVNIDRSSIVSIFAKYGIISDHVTNQELFEMCAQYLSSEDLNILEIALFGT